MIKAVVIDLDDTLCLTEASCFVLENAVLAKMGRPPMTRELHLRTWGQPLFKAIAVRSPGIDVNEFKKAYIPLIAKFTSTGKLDTIPPKNFKTLDALIDGGKEIYLLTSRTHSELRHLLEPDHALASRVKTFYYRDNMDYHKPDPRAFSRLLGEGGLEPHECVYVGDSPTDAQAAQDAGLHFIASLESGLRAKADFGKLKVNAYISTFPELLSAVRAIDA